MYRTLTQKTQRWVRAAKTTSKKPLIRKFPWSLGSALLSSCQAMQLVLTWGSDVCGSAIVCFQVCFLHILPICTSVWLQGTHWGFFGCDSIVLSKLLAPCHCQGTHWGFLATFLSSWHSTMVSVQHRYLSCVVTKVASVRKLYSHCPLFILCNIVTLFTRTSSIT